MTGPDLLIDAHKGLSQGDVNRIAEILKDGGLCILPSDSSYILTGLVTFEGVTKDIDTLLERNGLPMSLAFGGILQVTEMMDLSNQAYDFFTRLTGKGLTFVARAIKRLDTNLSARRLFTDGTIGIRISRSAIESRIAGFYPMPTTPIRNENRQEVATAKEAWEILSARLTKWQIHNRKIVLIDGSVEYPGKLSTVVREKSQDGYKYIKITRQGVIPAEEIEKVALECKYRGIL